VKSRALQSQETWPGKRLDSSRSCETLHWMFSNGAPKLRGWMVVTFLLVGATACKPGCTKPSPTPRLAAHTFPSAHARAPAQANPEPIRVEEYRRDEKAKNTVLRMRYPTFTVPNATVNTWLRSEMAAVIDHSGSLQCEGESDVSRGDCTFECEATMATTKIVSVSCKNMNVTGSIEDQAQGIGGAPADETFESYVWLLDVSPPRRATLHDIVEPGNETALLAELAKEVPELLPIERDRVSVLSNFSINEVGVTFTLNDTSHVGTGKGMVMIAWPRLDGLVTKDGCRARLVPRDAPALEPYQ
jgi:hypothetical protein